MNQSNQKQPFPGEEHCFLTRWLDGLDYEFSWASRKNITAPDQVNLQWRMTILNVIMKTVKEM